MDPLLVQLTQCIRKEYADAKRTTKKEKNLFKKIREKYYFLNIEQLSMSKGNFSSAVSKILKQLQNQEREEKEREENPRDEKEKIKLSLGWEGTPQYYEYSKWRYGLAD